MIRVYAGTPGKETVVLYSPNINRSESVLVRVHSECLTGDLFHSKKCDCGEQLEKSLQLIQKSGGVLVYLRQEGRGIGLFEKMKAYQLQEQGFDTFEANVMLGHKPDARSYELAKIALFDLGVKKVKLLTNNPSKVSELAKLGITVSERIPLVIPYNKINEKYFNTKRDKFKHFFAQGCQLLFLSIPCGNFV